MTNRKQFGILIALALGAGFVGGLVEGSPHMFLTDESDSVKWRVP